MASKNRRRTSRNLSESRVAPPKAPDVPLEQKIKRAVALHQQGLLSEAEQIYHDVLSVDPEHFAALHLLGVIRYQQGQDGEAIRLIGKALKRIQTLQKRTTI